MDDLIMFGCRGTQTRIT